MSAVLLEERPRYVSDRSDVSGHSPVYFEDGDGDRERLDLRLDLANHSPTGFGWGYGGSGPAQLALAILAHATSDEFAISYYQRFKADVIAVYPGDEALDLPRSSVDEWVEALEL